ncbi:MAG: Rieske 2Fe-2S domain-containing protein [Chloroflexota bacterium]|nr:Rieske 2Fe-2S domain-containing protein [Chloroflexota bacterium]
MATAVTTAQDKARAVSTERAAEVEVSLPSRREFLYYIWTASLLLLLGQAGAGLIWFALPRFKEGTFGGTFNFPPTRLPDPGSNPVTVAEGRFHVVRLEDESINVLYAVCTHLGCLPKWAEAEELFKCPCHGSQFQRDGQWVTGPAPRGLDRFVTTITFTDGTTAVNDVSGEAIATAGKTIESIAINTGRRVNGPVHA